MQKLQGWVEQGNTQLLISGAAGTIARKVQGSYPLATVTVYLNNPPPVSIVSISRTSNIVTVTVAAGSGFITGQLVTIAGVLDASFNGTFTIASTSPATFVYLQTAPNASSSGGTATSPLRLATIYADDGNPATVKANPFVAASDGTWFVYAPNGDYDVQFSGGGIATPFTIGDLSAGLGSSGVPSYPIASLPLSKPQSAGNLALVTDSWGGLWMDNGSSWNQIYPTINAAEMTGANAGAKIATAISRIPSTGGVVDARGLVGAQVISSTLTINKPILLLLGAAQYAAAAEINVTADNVWIDARLTTLTASIVGQNIIHWSAAQGGMIGGILDGNNVTGVSGLRVSPISESGAAVRTFTSFNSFKDVFIKNTAEGVVLRTGPTIAGSQSDCSYNAFHNIKVVDSLRALYFIEHPTDVTSASPDSNQFYSFLAFSRGVRTNTGIQIDAGGTNYFSGCSTIGMANGVSPNPTPTAVKIRGRAAIAGTDNNSNFFMGQRTETDTRALEITAPGGFFNSFIGISGFTNAKISDGGIGTVIMSSPYTDKNGLWYNYTDQTAIPVLSSPAAFGVQVDPADGAHSALDIHDITRGIGPEVGSLTIRNSATTNLKLILGYDVATGANGMGWILSLRGGITASLLGLQPNGGPVAIGCATQASAGSGAGLTLRMSNNWIPIFASNAAALAGGLVPGSVYRTGADPDPLMIVH